MKWFTLDNQDLYVPNSIKGNEYTIAEKGVTDPDTYLIRDGDTLLGWLHKSNFEGFDTGGYTGMWGPEGKLAFLHEKEIVLNKEDTSNLLESIALLRSILATIDL
jgi:hypothetical protein